MISTETIKDRIMQIDKEIIKWEDIIKNSPDGKLYSRERGEGKYEYSYRDDSSETKSQEVYIQRKDIKLAEQLALKEYAQFRLKDALKEKKGLEHYLSFRDFQRSADKYLEKHPGSAALILPMLRNKDEFIEQWASADYKRSNFHVQNLIYPTVVPGLYVRSKAEADIISRAVYYGIPFRYEEEVIINGIALHPDLTLLNVRTLKQYYWEHEGGWDKQKYVARLSSRLDDLAKIQIIPWDNLIITTETQKHPLDILWVDTIMQHFLL